LILGDTDSLHRRYEMLNVDKKLESNFVVVRHSARSRLRSSGVCGNPSPNLFESLKRFLHLLNGRQHVGHVEEILKNIRI
jgi:hypothetical protein